MAEVVHRCPPGDEGFTPCCGKTPFELPRDDRLTVDPDLVTCGACEGEAVKPDLDALLWLMDKEHDCGPSTTLSNDTVRWLVNVAKAAERIDDNHPKADDADCSLCNVRRNTGLYALFADASSSE